LKLALSLGLIVGLLSEEAQASRLWRWGYEAPGVTASGTFTTKDTADADGFYEIIGITGDANGVSITGLQPPGTSIPGNDGYPVDNLVRAGDLQLSKHGFGFALANGAYANPFYGAHFAPPGYYVFIIEPASGKSSEPSVAFTAAIVP
jgi:hypothetical protein